MNSRPLCYVDDADLTEPLTPSHLMYGRNIGKRNILNSGELNQNPNPKSRVKHVKTLLEHFWNRFSSEYVTSLRERDTKRVRKSGIRTEVKVGDVMMIHKKHIARCEWPLGKVEKLVNSEDGEIRGAQLKTAEGILNRPINLLYPLEMS